MREGGQIWLIEALKPDGVEIWLKAVEFRDCGMRIDGGGHGIELLPLIPLMPDGIDILLMALCWRDAGAR